MVRITCCPILILNRLLIKILPKTLDNKIVTSIDHHLLITMMAVQEFQKEKLDKFTDNSPMLGSL